VVKTLVDYLNVYLGTLGLRTEGIAVVRELDGNRWPALTGSGEDMAVNIDAPVIYHRILSGPTKGTDEDGSPRHDDPIATLTWSMRAVAVFDNIYCQDTEEKVIQNILATLKLASTDAIAESLLISQVSYQGNNSDRGLSAWEAEFGIAYDYSKFIVYVDYDIEAEAFESCFTVRGCQDDIDVIEVIRGEYCTGETPVCEDATVFVNEDEFGTVEAGGTLQVDVVDSNDDPVNTSIVGGKVVIDALPCDPCPPCDPVSVTVNSDSPAISVASGGSLNITNVNSAGTQIGTRVGSVITNANMTLDKVDGTTSAIVLVPGGTVALVPNWTIEGTFASPQSVTVPAWDSAFEVATQTITGGGTITGITVNAVSVGSTFVGVDLDGGDAVVITFTGTITKIVLTFV